MITDILGAPSLEDVAHVTSHHAVKSLLSQSKPRALGKLYSLSPTVSHGAVHLLSQMLVFNPVRLIYNTTHTLIHYSQNVSFAMCVYLSPFLASP